jgi:hypothetical protein
MDEIFRSRKSKCTQTALDHLRDRRAGPKVVPRDDDRLRGSGSRRVTVSGSGSVRGSGSVGGSGTVSDVGLVADLDNVAALANARHEARVAVVQALEVPVGGLYIKKKERKKHDFKHVSKNVVAQAWKSMISPFNPEHPPAKQSVHIPGTATRSIRGQQCMNE